MIKKTFKYIAAAILITCSFTFVACGNQKADKGVFVTKWDNYYEGSNIKFYYEGADNPNLQKLRTKYDLDEVVKDSKDDFEKSIKLMNWVNSKMKYSKSSLSTKKDALTILKEAENNNTLSDKDFNIVYSQSAASLGIFARRGEFRVKNSQADGEDSYFKVCEVWSDKYNKWIMLDVVNNSFMESNGVPLSAIEVLNSQLAGVNTQGVKNKEKYIKKLKPYMYSYSIEIDNNIYGMPKSNSFITYINGEQLPEIRIEGDIIRPTIFVKNDTLFNKSPRIIQQEQNAQKDKMPTLIFSKNNSENKKDGDNEIILNGAAFMDSANIEGYYISIDNMEWMEVKSYFTFSLKEGENNIRFSLDGKKLIREVIIEYKK
ncbi:transglutaminase-like domain-containing protein [Clostridium sp. MSJ-11]|uniref:Transglutaminase-like domain-containing protein n=1 Tax=Clostridium mobile TaxID=2841512 RepID=A0ABS6EMS5_9CLOT|nr:transglutaminase-like domain-containing protein [Clostridium mobile]MBU5486540.1 transglutaminase-like domain-containing protein [Clostridium mobile]